MKEDKQVTFCYKCKKTIVEGEGRYIIGGIGKKISSCVACYNKYVAGQDELQIRIDGDDYGSLPKKKRSSG
jgi:hypothetical protein